MPSDRARVRRPSPVDGGRRWPCIAAPAHGQAAGRVAEGPEDLRGTLVLKRKGRGRCAISIQARDQTSGRASSIRGFADACSAALRRPNACGARFLRGDLMQVEVARVSPGAWHRNAEAHVGFGIASPRNGYLSNTAVVVGDLGANRLALRARCAQRAQRPFAHLRRVHAAGDDNSDWTRRVGSDDEPNSRIVAYPGASIPRRIACRLSGSRMGRDDT
jgi:hypothetical protein